MPAEDFLSLARKHRCSTYQLRNKLRQHAVHKDGYQYNADDSNLLFPHSMIKRQLDFESVKTVLNCFCAVCKPVIVTDPFNDARIISEIRDEPGSRVMLAILTHMGAGFAMRLLHLHGLSRDHYDFDMRTVFERNPNNLKSKLFQTISGLFGSSPALSVDELAAKFCLIFTENKQLFNPPFFQEGDIFREIPLNSNLPFIQEMELRSRESSFARHYRLQIHKEFCSSALSELILIRKELPVAKDSKERDVLRHIQQKKHPNLISLHLAYRHGNNLNLVFTFFPMDLRHILRDLKQPNQPPKERLSQNLKGSILDRWLWKNMKGVFEAIQYVHDPNPEILGAHFDLKPANILVDDFGKLVITGFGLTRIKQKIKYHSSITNRGGDFNYCPPSSARETRLDRKHDIWSLACIMIEVIIYLRDGVNAVYELAEDLTTDDNVETPSQTFWKQDRGQYTLKNPVKIFLDELQDPMDLYLKQAGSLIQKMLSIDPDLRPTMNEVCDTLFAPNAVSSFPLKTDDRVQICGGNTQRPLKNMKISVQTSEPELNNACYLDYWWSNKTEEVSLQINYTHGDQIIRDTSRGPRSKEEIIPMNIYNRPDIVEEQMSCAFRYLHSNCIFFFSQSMDFYHFQAATTRQAVLVNAVISRCSLTLNRFFLSSRPLHFHGWGRSQLWRQIGNDEYRRDFVDDTIPIETETFTNKLSESISQTRPQWSLDAGSDSSNAYESSSVNQMSIRKHKLDKYPRRLVIFLPSKASTRYLTVPLSQGKAVLSNQEQNPNCITFERRRGRPHFDVGLFGDFGKHSFYDPGSISGDAALPGIPLDPLALENRERVHATSLEIEFSTPAARLEFLKTYHEAFLREQINTISGMRSLASTPEHQDQLNEAVVTAIEVLDSRRSVLGKEHSDTISATSNLTSTLEDQRKSTEAAAPMEKKVLESRKRALGEEHPDTISAMSDLASALEDQGWLNEAESMYQQALTSYEKNWDQNHVLTLNTINNLGTLYKNRSKLKEAEIMYQRALKGYEKALGPDHSSTLSTVNNLGNLYSDQGKLEEAKSMYQQALKGYEQAWSPDHTSRLTTVNNLGNLFSHQGQLEEAEIMYQQALKGYEKAGGPDHTSTLSTVNNLGILYRNQGKLDEAENMFQRALGGYQKALGLNHISTLGTANNLGSLHTDQGKLEEAKVMYEQALEGYKDALGLDHTLTLSTSNNLGNLYSNQGKLDAAEVMYQQTLRGYEKTLGPDHTSTLSTVNNLGNLYSDQGKLEKAKIMYQRALKGYETALGPDHSSTLSTVNNLGNLYRDQDQLEEAEVMYQQALKGYEKALGPDHTSTLTTVNNLGNLYSDRGELAEAEIMYQRALKGYEKTLGPDHTSTLTTVNNLGNLYSDRGELAEAEIMYQRALRGYEKTLGPDHISTLNTIQNLDSLYRDQGRLEEAEEMYRRTLQSYETTPSAKYGKKISNIAAFDDPDPDFRRISQEVSAETSKHHSSENYVTGIGETVRSISRTIGGFFQKQPTTETRNSIFLIIKWDLPAFIRQECCVGQSPGSLVVFTSNGQHTQASTCSEYMSWRWPHLSPLLIEILDKIVIENKGTTKSQLAGLSALVDWNGSKDPTTGFSQATFQLSGTTKVLVDCTVALAWLAAAMRRSSSEETSFSRASFEKTESLTHIAFRIYPEALTLNNEDQKLCWHGLFRQSVVASGFDVVSRRGGIGLEISLELLIELTENAKPFNYTGNLFLIGTHSALIPVTILDDHSIQWHLHISPDEISLQDLPENSALSIPATCIDDLKIKEFFQSLRSKRHFLGWCRHAKINLGISPHLGGMYRTKAFTQTSEKSKEIKFSSFSVGIASSGSGFAGPSATGTYTIAGTRKRFPDTPPERFESMLSTARRMPSLLYNPEEKRAWMVPVICVLYDMALLRIMRDGYEVGLPYVVASWDGATAVYDAIILNRRIAIGPQDVENPFLFSDLLEDLWLNLKLMKLKQPRRRTWLLQNFLLGRDLMEIVNRVSPFTLRTAPVRDSGGWIELMREIEVVLFCNGLGDVIAPKDPSADACRFISSVPPDHDFLCTTIGCLQNLSERAASSQACELLAKDCFWHSPKPLFRSCHCHDRGECDPFQQIIKVKNGGIFGRRVLPPNDLVAEGAIIFGTRPRDLPQLEARDMPSSHRTRELPSLRRSAKNRNLRINIDQPTYFRQDQKNT